MDFKLDENGKLLDSDEIYDKLDELEELGDYKGMVELIASVPSGERSLKLNFVLASALINAEDYRGATALLRQIYPDCKEQADLAQIFYYSGYAVSALGGNFVLGLSLFKDALANDPKDELGLDIVQECRDCAAEIEAQIAVLHELCLKAAAVIADMCKKADSGAVFEGMGLAARLSFFNIFRNAPGLASPLGSDDGADKPECADKAALADWLDKLVGVRDHDSMIEMFRTERSFNIASLADDVICYLKGKPKFDLDILDEKSRGAFNTYTMLIECFVNYLPPAGLLAWDIAKRIAVVRFAFGADLISDEDYKKTMDELLASAKGFGDSEEFLLSLLFGSVTAAFDAESANLSAAVRALNLTMPEILNCDLPGSVWIID